MRLPLSWLRDFVPYEGSAEDLAVSLTVAGLEVEEIVRPGEIFKGVTVAEVLEAGRHPDADRLSVCSVTIGGEPIPVVCGAPNVAAGQKVPFAEVGTLLPNGMRLKKAKIRGEVSMGMICSEVELEIGDDAAGIVVLPEEAAVGTSFAEYLGIDDEIIEIDVTPNRPDALSIYGLARETAALFQLPLEPPDFSVNESGPAASETISVAIEDFEGCPRYSARLIRNVRIDSSPPWLAGRLRAVGLRPINLIVDITNYTMMELGQPQHAFDLRQVAGGSIIVRRAREGEALRTLDEKVQTLDPELLVIADPDRALAVAGVMGGFDSEISGDTTDVLLESAHFNPIRVSIGGGRLDLITESGKRFERGTDPTITGRAADRTARLIADMAGGEVAAGLVEQVAPEALEQRAVSVRKTWVDSLLGASIPDDEATGILERLGFEVNDGAQAGEWQVTIPPWRPDADGPAHVAEELARVWGYDNLGSDTRLSGEAAAGPTLRQKLRVDIRNAMVHFGFYEVITDSLVGRDAAHPFLPGSEPVVLANPRGEESSELRRDLLPGVLRALAHNHRHQMTDVRIFEIGMVHRLEGDKALEQEWIVGALHGSRLAEIWDESSPGTDWFDLTGLMAAHYRALRIDTPRALPYNGAALDASTGIRYVDDDENETGLAGRLTIGFAEALGFTKPVWVFGFRLDSIETGHRSVRRYQGLPRFPAAERDLSLILPLEAPVGTIIDRLKTEKRVEDVRLVERYTGDQIPADRKGVLLSLRLRDIGNTMSDSDLEDILKKLVKILENEFGARLRG